LLIAATDVAQGEAQRGWFAQRGIGVLRRRALTHLGWVLTIYRIPPGTDLPTLLAEFATLWPDALSEMNQRYLHLAAPEAATRYAAALIGSPIDGCSRSVRVAMLDGPVNLALAAFKTRVQAIDIAERSARPDYAHANGIAALLLGTESVPGLLPNAQLLAANVFAEQHGKPYTTTEWILRGLDWTLGEAPVAVVNLSFGGAESAQLAQAIQRVQRQMRVVAAAGNDGTTRPVFPAALTGVVAVTAVDVRRRHWPRANSGEYVAIAAPGVDVWTIDGIGRGYYATGTSFAAIFVSAALALGAPAQPALGTWLKLHAEDLGPPGRDRLFGFGLLRAGGLCP
jgi:subtilisin family serine protease